MFHSGRLSFSIVKIIAIGILFWSARSGSPASAAVLQIDEQATGLVPANSAGVRHVMSQSHTTSSQVSRIAKRAARNEDSVATRLQPGLPTVGVNGHPDQALLYTFDVPTGATDLVFRMSGIAGDADLYVRFGAAPTSSTHDCRPHLGGNNETCAMPSATAGTWYVMIRGYSAFEGVRLMASYAISGRDIVIPPPAPSAAVCITTSREKPAAGRLPCPVGGSERCRNYSISPKRNKSKGSVTITDAKTGKFVYAPRGTVWGVDTFRYSADDVVTGNRHSATGVVIISPRLMPLGDSITAGISGSNSPDRAMRVGYRKPLYDALLAAGYPVDFVGSRNDGYAVSNFDADHEGHAGWSAFEMLFGTPYIEKQDPKCPNCGIIDWLNAKKPDVILLHIGTNNFSTSTTDVAAILNTIDHWSTSPEGNPVAIFLAQIINRRPYQSVDVLTYNWNLSVLVQRRQRAGVGPSTFLVNQESALAYPTDLVADPTGLHPDANGYAKMADKWFTELIGSGLMLRCP